MAVDLDSGNGLFDRLGRLGYALNVTNTFIGGTSADDLPTEIEDVLDEYESGTNDEKLAIEGLLIALASQQSGMSTIRNALRTAGQL